MVGQACPLASKTVDAQNAESSQRLFENLLPSAPDEEANWREVQSTFAQLKEELASFKYGEDDIKLSW